MTKVSDFISSRGGRAALEVRWMEALAAGLQVRRFTPEVSSATGTFSIVDPTAKSDHYVYCCLNNLTAVSFSVECQLTTADSQFLYITLPTESIPTGAWRGVVYSGVGNVPAYLSVLADSRQLVFERENAPGIFVVDTYILKGNFFYFSKLPV